jgi:predicted RNA-binding Zn-ribbon protein involved in translation (DUF1610 family)
MTPKSMTTRVREALIPQAIHVDPASEVCLSCQSVVTAKMEARGPAWIGWVLLLGYFVPGVIYFIWRRKTKQPVCPKCGSNALVPGSSPRALEILAASNAPKPVTGGRNEMCPACMLPLVFPYDAEKVRCPHCTSIIARSASGALFAED